MGCLGNSKTEDQRIDEKAQREANKKIEKQLQKERLAYKATHRLLLLGKAAGQGRAGPGGPQGQRAARAGPGAPRPADAGGGGRCCAPAARPACHRAPSPFSSRGRRVGEKHHRETDEDPARQWV